MSRTDDCDDIYPMSYPVDADSLYFALNCLIADKRSKIEFNRNVNRNGLSAPRLLCPCDRPCRELLNEQIDIPDVEITPTNDYQELPITMKWCIEIFLGFGYLLPLSFFFGLYFFLARIGLNK